LERPHDLEHEVERLDPADSLAVKGRMGSDVAKSLAETVAWCSRHARAADAGASTRSPALCPPVMALPQEQRLSRLLNLPGEPKAAVESVCEARRRELSRLDIPVVPVGPDFARGRILFTTIDTDSCAASTGPSNGYYDWDDLPGWDTWFYHRPTDRPWGAIYCWVPAHLIELARNGMDVIPVMSVEWAHSIEELSC
jgi:hypothetical protein